SLMKTSFRPADARVRRPRPGGVFSFQWCSLLLAFSPRLFNVRLFLVLLHGWWGIMAGYVPLQIFAGQHEGQRGSLGARESIDQLVKKFLAAVGVQMNGIMEVAVGVIRWRAHIVESDVLTGSALLQACDVIHILARAEQVNVIGGDGHVDDNQLDSLLAAK